MATTGTGQGGPGGNPMQRDLSSSQSSSNVLDDRRAVGTESAGIKDTLRDTTYRSLDDQKARASDTLGSLAGAVRGMTQPLREGGQPQIADYVNKAADGIERWASDLRQQDLEDAVRAVEQFARRQPAMFLGLAFGAGMVAARFLKSSGSNGRTREYGEGFNPSGGPTAFGTSSYNDPEFSGTGRSFDSTSSTSRGDIPRVGSDIRSTGEVI